jgi:hypothetical protein
MEKTETTTEWLTRLSAEPALEAAGLQELARLHYRHRFDPEGLPATQRDALRALAHAWLARQAKGR